MSNPTPTRKKPVQHERREQKSIMAWAKWQPFNGGKLSDYLHHSPNGGSRNKIEGKHFKDMGTMAGFPDLFLFIPKHGWHGLFIELKQKNAKQSNISDNQSEVLKRLENQGYCCKVCFGANQAIETIKKYLHGMKISDFKQQYPLDADKKIQLALRSKSPIFVKDGRMARQIVNNYWQILCDVGLNAKGQTLFRWRASEHDDEYFADWQMLEKDSNF